MEFSNYIALDYEMFNSKNYYSICWAAAVDADKTLEVIDKRVFKVNPQTDKQFTGKNIVFPFTAAELKKEKKFGELYPHIFAGTGENTLFIGHGFLNDIKMTLDACKKDGVPFPSFYYIDTNVCLSAVTGTWCEKSLSVLAEEIGFTFCAHDPLEDAEATLKVMKNLAVKEGCETIEEFLQKFEIVPGRVSGGMVTKSYYEKLEQKQKEKILRYNENVTFALAQKKGIGNREEIAGRSFAFDASIFSDYDVRFVLKRLYESGACLAYDGYIADVRVTNNILMANRDDMLFKDLCLKLDFRFDELKELSFYPDKVRDEQNNPISYSEYLSRFYSRLAPTSGKLKNKTVVFSKTVEMANDFEEVFRNTAAMGARVSSRVDEADYFVVGAEAELNCAYFDGRIRAYKRLVKEGTLRARLIEKQQLIKLW